MGAQTTAERTPASNASTAISIVLCFKFDSGSVLPLQLDKAFTGLARAPIGLIESLQEILRSQICIHL